MAALAGSLKLAFRPGGDWILPRKLCHFRAFARGVDAEARNVIEGVLNGRDVQMFDYFCESSHGEGQKTHEFSAAVITIDETFPARLLIRHETLVDGLVAAFGLQAISFESHEFNRVFHVDSDDRKFAYDVVDPRMMEYLLANPGWAFEVAGPDVMAYTGKRWAPDEFEPAIRALTGFIERIPEHVLANWRGVLSNELSKERSKNGRLS